MIPRDFNGDLVERPSKLLEIEDPLLSWDFDQAFKIRFEHEKKKAKAEQEARKKIEAKFKNSF